MKRTTKLIIYLGVMIILLMGISKAYFFPSRVNTVLLMRIEADYAEYMYDHGAKKGIDGPWRVKDCYGIYDGSVAVIFSGLYDQACWDIEIAGTTFHYNDGGRIEIWKNGVFYSMEDAYKMGLLTSEQVAAIAEIHNKR